MATATLLMGEIRAAEAWSVFNVLGAVVLAAVAVAALVIAVRVIWRR